MNAYEILEGSRRFGVEGHALHVYYPNLPVRERVLLPKTYPFVNVFRLVYIKVKSVIFGFAIKSEELTNIQENQTVYIWPKDYTVACCM